MSIINIVKRLLAVVLLFAMVMAARPATVNLAPSCGCPCGGASGQRCDTPQRNNAPVANTEKKRKLVNENKQDDSCQ